MVLGYPKGGPHRSDKGTSVVWYHPTYYVGGPLPLYMAGESVKNRTSLILKSRKGDKVPNSGDSRADISEVGLVKENSKAVTLQSC